MANNGGVTFEDYTIEVTGAISDAINIALEECAGEVEAQTKRNTKWRSGDQTPYNAWTHRVDDANHTAYIGNPMESALWEEFGTGTHAINKNGRKGYWVYVKGGDSGAKKSTKQYTLEEAKQAVAILRSKGLEAYYTNGREAVRPFYKAYTALKNSIINRLQNALKGL